MRLTPTPTAVWQGESFARKTGRTVPDALNILINEGFRAVTGKAQSTAPAVSIDPSTSDGDASPGRTVAAYLPARMVEVIQFLADEQKRTISFTVKALIRESLERRDLWRKAKAPLLSPPSNAADTPAAV